jgi:hypothetical protein
MATGVAKQLGKGIEYLGAGGTVEEYMAQVDTAHLTDAERDDLRELLLQSATLFELGQLPVPTPREKVANRARFLSAVSQPRGVVSRVLARLGLAQPAQLRRGLVGVGLAVVLLLVTGISAVSASVDSLPGSTLYRLKLAAENVRVAVASDTLTRARLYTRFASERSNEIVRLAAAGESADEAVLRRMAYQWEAAVREAESAAHTAGSEPLVQVLDASTIQEEAIRRAKSEAQPAVHPALDAGAVIVEEASRLAVAALQRIEPPSIQTTPTITETSMPLPAVSQPPEIQPTQSPTLTRTSNPTMITVTWTAAPPGVTASPLPSVALSPTVGATLSLSPTSEPVPQPSAVPSVMVTATPSVTAPVPSDTPQPTHTSVAGFYLSLDGTPDFVPASYRIHYVLCVVNDTDLPLTNVSLVDSWSPRACVYFPPDNPGQISWQLGTVGSHSRVCQAFALSTFSICGGVTVTNEATMTCDQGSARVVEYTRIVGTPTATALPTVTATITPTGTLTTTLTASPTGELTPTLTLTPTVP